MRTLKIAAPLVVLALLSTGCTSASEVTQPGPEADSPPVTVTETVPAPSHTLTDPTAIAPAECSTDVYSSDFGPTLSRGVVQLGDLGDQPWEVVPVADWFYHFQIKDNGYDSCRELSYLALAGSNGDVERSAGIGSAINDAVVFFHYGDMITNPAPFEMKTVVEVSRRSDFQLQVIYGHAGGATAEGVTETYALTFFYDNGLSATGELPDSIDSHLRLFLG